MFDEYEVYQGLVLRHVIADAEQPVSIHPFVTNGRVSSFVINNKVGLYIKHSSKRLTPWRFTFHIDQISDLLDLEIKHPRAFAVFVCGRDGMVALDVATLHQLVSFEDTEQAWLRINRQPRAMYDASGNRGRLDGKLPRGCSAIFDSLTFIEQSKAA